MRFLFFILYTLVIMGTTLSVGHAADYYISNEIGNDDRSMLEARNPNTPWKSIEKVNTVFHEFKPGDGILFRRGETFYGTLHMKASGSPTLPIRIGAYGSGSKPIITSFQTITGWESIGNGIFESTVPINTNTVQVLVINGLLQNMGRYPNAGIINDGYLTINQVENDVIYNDELNSSPNWTGGEVVIRPNDWIINKYKISFHTGNQIQYNGAISNYKAQLGYGFFIQNHLRTLDLFGEWYYDSIVKKMNVYLGSANPNELVIEVSTLEHLLTKDYNVGNITVENIKFKGANGSAIYFEGGRNINIRDSEIAFSGEDGIQALSVLDLMIERNSINHTYNNGMFLRYGNDGAIIRNNEISNTSLHAGRTRNGEHAGIGIFVSGENLLVENNAVLNTGFNGIHFNGNNVVIKNNYVAKFCQIKSDGAGIYTYGGSIYRGYEGRVIEGNIVTNSNGAVGGTPKINNSRRALVDGIFLDDNSNNIDVIGNSIGNVANGGLKMSNVSYINVRNNTFFDSHAAVILGNNTLGQDVRHVIVSNNQFFAKSADQHSLLVTTHKDDIALMANFDDNYYFRPLGDKYSILTRFLNDGEINESIEDLDHWRAKYGKDQNSISNDVDIATYTIEKIIGESLYSNSTFDRNIMGVGCNHCQQTWEPNSKIAGGALKVSSSGSSSVKINLGELKKDKKYLLKFKAYAEKPGSLMFYLRYSGSPWERLSEVKTFEVTPEVGVFEAVVSPHQDASEVSLMIADSEINFTYWLDDLEILEVEASLIDPEDVMLFQYNPTKTSKTLNLAGTYVDAKLDVYSGSVTIHPYGSLALLRMSEEGKESVPDSNHQFFLNTGGATDEGINDVTFLAETGMKQYYNIGTATYENGSLDVDALFQTERYSKILKYNIPVPNGTYTVFTLHNELWFGQTGSDAASGNRVFDIALQGKILKGNFDIFVENENKPTLLSFNDIVVTDGYLSLEMTAKANNASISGIAIIGNASKDGSNIASLIRFQQSGNSEQNVEIEDSLIRIFPNPARERATLEISAFISNGNVLIHNMNGQLVGNFDLDRIRISDHKFNIPINNLSPGIYRVSVTNDHNLIYRQSLIVNK